MNYATILLEAADSIDEYGWTQGASYTPVDELPPAQCPRCARGAIWSAVNVFNEPMHTLYSLVPQPLFDWVGDWLADRYGYPNIHTWNDSQATRLNMKENPSFVQNVLRQAAAEWLSEAAAELDEETS